MALTINNTSLPIQTVAPSINIGEIMLKADKRSTEDKPIPEDQRIRRVVLPAETWGELAASINGERSQALTDVLRAALVEIGSKRLKDALAESPMLREVPLADYTVAELLKWNEETATSRGSITFTREDAEKWYDTSETRKAREALWKEGGANDATIKARHQFLRNRFGALAAKNHGLKESAEAIKLMAMIADADTKSSIVVEITGRLAHIVKQLEAKEQEATVSMDSL